MNFLLLIKTLNYLIDDDHTDDASISIELTEELTKKKDEIVPIESPDNDSKNWDPQHPVLADNTSTHSSHSSSTESHASSHSNKKLDSSVEKISVHSTDSHTDSHPPSPSEGKSRLQKIIQSISTENDIENKESFNKKTDSSVENISVHSTDINANGHVSSSSDGESRLKENGPFGSTEKNAASSDTSNKKTNSSVENISIHSTDSHKNSHLTSSSEEEKRIEEIVPSNGAENKVVIKNSSNDKIDSSVENISTSSTHSHAGSQLSSSSDEKPTAEENFPTSTVENNVKIVDAADSKTDGETELKDASSSIESSSDNQVSSDSKENLNEVNPDTNDRSDINGQADETIESLIEGISDGINKVARQLSKGLSYDKSSTESLKEFEEFERKSVKSGSSLESDITAKLAEPGLIPPPDAIENWYVVW